MRAARFYGGRDIRVEEIPAPTPGPGEVLVRIRSAGICGSDLHNYRGNRAPVFSPPWEQGHELAGEVAALGQGVTNLRVGQRVAIEGEHLVGCGVCRHCLAGDYHICPRRGFLSGERHSSHGFSEYDVCLAKNCYPLPNNVSYDEAVLLDSYACAVHALNRAPIRVTDTVAVIGTGAIGLTLGQVAKVYGAQRVIMIGTRQPPLRIAQNCGAADEVIATDDTDPVEAVMKLTDGLGADAVFETVGGNAQILAQAMALARRGGTISVMGVFTAPQTIDPSLGFSRELTVRWSNSLSSWRGIPEFRTAIELVSSGRVIAAPIITHHFPIEKISEAFAATDDKRSSGAIRVVVHA